MSIKYRTGQGTSASNFTDLVVKVGDTLPIGSEIDYDGQTVPAGWQEVDDPSVYSTTETRVGTWIDGKPLYRKTIYSTAKTGSLGLSNVDFLRWKNFNAFVNNEYLFPDARSISSTDKIDFFVNKTQKSFTLSLGSTWDSKFTYLVFDIEYTKTTD
jgi:hypothetical protein